MFIPTMSDQMPPGVIRAELRAVVRAWDAHAPVELVAITGRPGIVEYALQAVVLETVRDNIDEPLPVFGAPSEPTVHHSIAWRQWGSATVDRFMRQPMYVDTAAAPLEIAVPATELDAARWMAYLYFRYGHRAIVEAYRRTDVRRMVVLERGTRGFRVAFIVQPNGDIEPTPANNNTLHDTLHIRG